MTAAGLTIIEILTLSEHGSDYEEGLRDGRLKALEHRIENTETVRDNHERRLVYLERIVWGFAGVLFLSTIWPRLEVIVGAMK